MLRGVLRGVLDGDAAELRRLTSLLLDRKEFSVVGGLKLTDMLAVSIAAQAALPALRAKDPGALADAMIIVGVMPALAFWWAIVPTAQSSKYSSTVMPRVLAIRCPASRWRRNATSPAQRLLPECPIEGWLCASSHPAHGT